MTPIGVYLENDHPAPMEVLEVLYGSLLQRLRNKEVIAGAICSDILYKPNDSEVTVDALKIMTITIEGYSRDYIVPYKNDDGHYTFGEILSKEGTLNLSED